MTEQRRPFTEEERKIAEKNVARIKRDLEWSEHRIHMLKRKLEQGIDFQADKDIEGQQKLLEELRSQLPNTTKPDRIKYDIETCELNINKGIRLSAEHEKRMTKAMISLIEEEDINPQKRALEITTEQLEKGVVTKNNENQEQEE